MVDEDQHCDLCEAARITPWFHEDDICWVAECEFCDVPMVVWKVHDNAPPDHVKQHLHARLQEVVAVHGGERFAGGHYIDDNMRNIPDHYHAHARPRRLRAW
ncbi:MAG: hypothetical protein JWN62_2085 [Acidimicrobiales bacterium]|nr:hypothetical protein [Acidimicrobiales bacterium]